MRLAVRVTGTGARTAVLIHGFMSDSRAWHRVTADLEQRGFRVLAVDLAGHGASPCSRRYSPRTWADDVVETLDGMLDGSPDLVMGHSLGGLVASLVADRLSPRTAIYVDPAFGFPSGIRGVLVKLLFALSPRPRRTILVKLNPKWDAADLEAELAGLRDWDRRTLLGLRSTRPLVPPATLVAPSLVVLAEKSWLVPARAVASLRGLGMTVETIPGSGHAIFRDEYAGFLGVLDRWLDQTLPVSA
jgi:pimeloyl-ACP methyl ester carboxylesterase